MDPTSNKRRHTAFCEHTITDITHQLPHDQAQQYTALVKEHAETTSAINEAGSSAVHQQMTDCLDIVQEIQYIVHRYTNIDSVDMFKPSSAAKQTQSKLLTLSDGVLINIQQFVQIDELIELREVCVQLRALVFNSEVWRHGEVQYEDNEHALQHLCWYLRTSKTDTMYSAECVADYILKHYMHPHTVVYMNFIDRLKSITTLIHTEPGTLTGVQLLLQSMPNIQHFSLSYLLDTEQVLGALQSLEHLQSFTYHYSIDEPNMHSDTMQAFTALSHVPRIVLVLSDPGDIEFVNPQLAAEHMQWEIDEYQQLSNCQVVLLAVNGTYSFDVSALNIVQKPGFTVD